jgi:glycine/D-amino acid oxidase-like deaminating enzyme
MKLPDREQSLWRDYYPKRPIYPKLKADAKTDVVIVGAGITGLTCAYLLKKSGMKVIVLEKNTIGSGTSGRTTGKVTSQHNLMYSDMIKRLGAKSAKAYAMANQAAVERIRQIVKSEKIDCNWQTVDNYIFTTNPHKTKMLKQESKAAAGLGLPSTFDTKTPLPFKVLGAVRFTRQGKINSQKYLLGLAKAVNGNGSYVYEKSQVTSFNYSGEVSVRVGERSVLAKTIIVVTKIPSYPLAARASYALLEYPTESFGIACEIAKPLQGMYISPDKDNYSLLPIKMGRKHMLVVVGAGGNIPGVRLSKEDRYQKLADYAVNHFQATAITHKWADMDYLAYDRFPLVGRVYPWSENMYTATGFMKWGLSNGTAAAIMLHDKIMGTDNDWASAYDSSRIRPITHIPSAIHRHIKQKIT